VEQLIDSQRRVDDGRKLLTELHHAAKVDLQREAAAPADWLSDLDGLERTRLNNRKAAAAASDQLRVYEEKLARIDEASIDEARKDRDSLRVSLNAKQDERTELQAKIDQAKATIADLKPLYDSLRRKEEKLEELNDRLTVTEDMAAVVQGALEDIQQRYVTDVSRKMNDLFLEMVGADPAAMESQTKKNQSRVHVFREAAITPAYEIAVYTADNRTLDPDHELNGASKRALTFSFIWALTEVSGVIAPRIIDTPFGMMSGAVRARVVELITAPSGRAVDIEKQVVLFLTRDEIRGIENVIDARAGKIVTYTNSDHYPVDVLNNPEVDVPEILVCGCNHHQFCNVCARRNDALYDLVQR
jgi:DNA sulfur modification protein DndD